MGIAQLLFEADSLRHIARSHRQALGTSDMSDNIASHTSLVCMIGFVLAHQVPGANPGRVQTMCLFHDLPESRTGDQNWIHKKHVKANEEVIRDNQLRALEEIAPGTREMMGEYDARESIDSKVAKDADSLAQIVLLKVYAYAGNGEAARWLESIENKRKRLHTDEAKTLLDEIYAETPSGWWRNVLQQC